MICTYIWTIFHPNFGCINTKHQLDSEEVDIAVKNNSNEKELKEANGKIKELKDKVENLAVAKNKGGM